MESEETVFFQCHYLTITGKQGAGCPARAMNADDCEDAVELGDPTATICSGRHALEKDLLWGPGYWQALWYPQALLSQSLGQEEPALPTQITLKARKPNTLD